MALELFKNWRLMLVALALAALAWAIYAPQPDWAGLQPQHFAAEGETIERTGIFTLSISGTSSGGCGFHFRAEALFPNFSLLGDDPCPQADDKESIATLLEKILATRRPASLWQGEVVEQFITLLRGGAWWLK